MPAYARISEDLASRIAAGELAENEQLPTERELCENYGVSRITVRHALALLEQQGLIWKRQGQGIFVSPNLFDQLLDGIYSLDQSLIKQGARHTSSIIFFEIKIVRGEVSRALALGEPNKCHRLVRIDSIDGRPYAYNVIYVPLPLLEGVSKTDIEHGGLQRYLRGRDSALEQFEAVLAPPEVTKALGRKPPMPVMKLTRVSYRDGSPIKYMTSYIAGDKLRFNIHLE